MCASTFFGRITPTEFPICVSLRAAMKGSPSYNERYNTPLRRELQARRKYGGGPAPRRRPAQGTMEGHAEDFHRGHDSRERDRDQRDSRAGSRRPERQDGVLVIKAQQHRSLERNREEALARLHELVARAAAVPRQRRPTRPTRSSQKKRLESKTRRGQVKKLRGRIRSATD